MDLKQKLTDSLHDAMRSGDEVAKRAIRLTLASIKLAEVEKGGVLDDVAILSLLQKEIKIKTEAIEEAQKANRADLIAANEADIVIIRRFLPEMLSEDKLRDLARAAIAETQAQNLADMGKVMKTILPRIEGRAPNDQVSRIVRELLNG